MGVLANIRTYSFHFWKLDYSSFKALLREISHVINKGPIVSATWHKVIKNILFPWTLFRSTKLFLVWDQYRLQTGEQTMLWNGLKTCQNYWYFETLKETVNCVEIGINLRHFTALLSCLPAIAAHQCHETIWQCFKKMHKSWHSVPMPSGLRVIMTYTNMANVVNL